MKRRVPGLSHAGWEAHEGISSSVFSPRENDGSPTPKGEILRWIFRELGRNGIPYCVLRNADSLPAKVGNDIDILTHSSAFPRLECILLQGARSFGWSARRKGRFYWIFFRFCEGNWDFFRLDFVTDLRRGGGKYGPPGFLRPENQFLSNGIRRLRPTEEFFHVLIHSLFGPAYNRERYGRYLGEQLDSGRIRWETLRDYLGEIFPPRTNRRILGKLKEGDVRFLFHRRKWLEFLFLLRAGALGSRWARCGRRWLGRCRRILKPPGRFVVLVGPDGVGKSTAAECAASLLRIQQREAVHVHLGFRPGVLPTRERLGLRRRNQGEEPCPGKGKPLPRGGIRVMKPWELAYHALDYFLGYFLRVRPVLRRNGIVIAERYHYDFLAGSRKNPKVESGSWMVRLFFAPLPRPDIVVLLSCDPDGIRRRSQELPRNEIVRQLRIFEEMGRKEREFFMVRTEKSIGEVAVEIVDRILGTGRR